MEILQQRFDSSMLFCMSLHVEGEFHVVLA